MREFFYVVGQIVGIFSFLIIIAAIISAVSERLSQKSIKKREKRKKEEQEKEFSNSKFIFAVKIPSKTAFYTTVAHIYKYPSGGFPIVTIVNAAFFNKLPSSTPVICLNKKYAGGVRYVSDIRRLRRIYIKSIKES